MPHPKPHQTEGEGGAVGEISDAERLISEIFQIPTFPDFAEWRAMSEHERARWLPPPPCLICGAQTDLVADERYPDDQCWWQCAEHPEHMFDPDYVEMLRRDAQSDAQGRPYQEDGHLAADDWWRLHPEGMA